MGIYDRVLSSRFFQFACLRSLTLSTVCWICFFLLCSFRFNVFWLVCNVCLYRKWCPVEQGRDSSAGEI